MKVVLCTLFGTTASIESQSNLPITSAVPLSSCKGIMETFILSQKLSIVINLLESSIFQVLETLFTFGFTGLVQKQFRIYLSHTLKIRLTAWYCCTTVTHHFLLIRCSPLQFFLPLPKTLCDLWNKAEIFVSCLINLCSSIHTMQCAR